ncbi:MAG TPA: ABC transporter ATP-binding protein [Candidatus Limnocylindrales bacterium]|nr:ABC transporter ATP-binding protein [Candidatus Limnocylindrales bacterium]
MPNDPAAGDAAGADTSAEQAARPWEVAAPGSATTRDALEQPRTRRRVTVSQLLADVPDDAVIVARRLSKAYGEFAAVSNLDLTIRAGEVFGLLGPNGAGKTTTVLMILGLTEPTRGVVRVLGLDPTREPLRVKRKVGYLPDNVGFYGGMTGRENLRYTAKLNGLARTAAEARIDELLAEVRLTDAADRKAETYSRGMRQRLGIADALVKNPSVLILDEPTIAIDPAGVEELLALLRRLVTERNLTVLLSSHILGQVQSLCDRVGFFSAGRLIAAGPLDELARGTDRTIQLEVGVEGPPAAIDPVAAALPGVRSVEPSPDNDRYRIVTATEDVAGPLVTALAAAGVPLVHLRRRGADLLDLYRRFVPEASDGRAR